MPAGRCRAAPDHVLVGAADIRRYDLEDDAVVDRLSSRIAKGRKVDLLNFDTAGFEVNHATIGIGRHLQSPLGLGLHFSTRCVSVDGGAPSARAQTSSTISMYERILGLSPQADSNRADSNIIDLPANDFALLAAIGPILRQFSAVSGLRIDDDVSTRELPMTLSLQITDAVERFSLPSNDSEEAPEAMEVTLTPTAAS